MQNQNNNHNKAFVPFNDKESQENIIVPTSIIVNNEDEKPKQLYKFISKLIEILENDEITNIISWSDDETVIEIYDEKKFIDQILPKYFKHNSMSNFIRQLNMYNFKKLKQYHKEGVSAYKNPLFKKNSNSLIHEINRKSHTNTLKNQVAANKDISETSFPVINNESDKVGFLITKLNHLEQEVSNFKKTNNSIIEFNNNITKDINTKKEYVSKLESLVFFIINHIIPQKLTLREDNELINNTLKQNSIAASENNEDQLLLTLYQSALADCQSGNIDTFPEISRYFVKNSKFDLLGNKTPLENSFDDIISKFRSKVMRKKESNLESSMISLTGSKNDEHLDNESDLELNPIILNKLDSSLFSVNSSLSNNIFYVSSENESLQQAKDMINYKPN